MEIDLDPVEARVLGALMEKQYLTPDAYPLSLNALVAACNQTTSRDPVVSYDEQIVLAALDRLCEKKLCLTVNQASNRVAKYHQTLSVQMNFKTREQAVLCLLLLRGPQTLGEIKSRSGRLYEFADLNEVEETVARLADDRYPPKVMKLPRQPGMKESRYADLLRGELPPPEPSFTERLEKLEQELADLRQQFTEFRKQFE